MTTATAAPASPSPPQAQVSPPSALAPYTITISKGSALLPEMRTLLRTWHEDEPLPAFRDRVVAQDLLGKTTARRASDLVERVFARRFLRPDAAPARHLQQLLDAPSASRLVNDLCLLYSARLDALLYDVVTVLYWPAVRDGRLSLGTDDVLSFLHEAGRSGRIPKPWSDSVRVKVTRGMMRALEDFGLLRAAGPKRKDVVLFHPDDGSLVYLAHQLHFAGLTDAAVVAHPDWGLFGLHPGDVASALDRLSGDGWWLVQRAGSIVRVDWTKASMKEVVDALAR